MFRGLLFVFLTWFTGSAISFAQYNPVNRCIPDTILGAITNQRHIQNTDALLNMAQVIWDTLPDKAYDCMLSALRISISNRDVRQKGEVHCVFGQYFARKRDFSLALEHFLTSLNIFGKCKDTTGQLKVLLFIADINLTLNNNPKALEYYQKGIGLTQDPRHQNSRALFQDYTGFVYKMAGDTSKALLYFRMALENYRKTRAKNNEHEVLNNIGTLLIDQNRFNEALIFYDHLLREIDTSNKILLGVVYTCIGHIYQRQNQYNTSLEFNKKALQVRRNLIPYDNYISSLVNIGGDFLLLGKPDSGRYYLDAGLKMAQRFNLKNIMKNGYRHLYSYYLKKGNYEAALPYYKNYVETMEDLEQERSNGNISFFEANQAIQQSLETGRMLVKQHEIQKLSILNQQIQFIFVQVITSLAALVLMIFLILFLYNRHAGNKLLSLNRILSVEINDRRNMELNLSEKERQYRFLAEHTFDLIIHMDAGMNRIFASPSSRSVYGYEPDEILEISPFDLTHPDHHNEAQNILEEMVASRQPKQFTYRIIKKDGSVAWIESVLNPQFESESGNFRGIVVVARDIQERKTKEMELMENAKQTENLLKEIHHRVKNNFAILVSLISMQMEQSQNEELKRSLVNLQLRIRTMALVHEMLYRSKDFENISVPEYLRSVVAVIAGAYRNREVDLHFEADEATMNIEIMIPIGLIVNEIVSNVFKHAFPEGAKGNLWIRFKYDKPASYFHLEIRDDGPGIPEAFLNDQVGTMGLQIIHLLCRQIEAQLKISNEPGASFAISFHSDTR